MRKNSVRKFIHAILDLLPLFVIPIFAIYSMNHEISGNSINTSGYEVRNKYETNEVNTLNDLVEGNIYHSDSLEIASDFNTGFDLKIVHFDEYDISNGQNYYIDEIINGDYNANKSNYVEINYDYGDINVFFTNEFSYVSLVYSQTSMTFTNCDFVIYDIGEFVQYCTLLQVEPITRSDFNILEYVYNDGIVLDDEDIMSQFVYVTYNAVDKYFNMGNVFNMNGVYDWFVVNIFGGNAPISMFIVWNVVLYEFVMDLLMLLYGLFMWFIDMIERLMSKPLDSIK